MFKAEDVHPKHIRNHDDDHHHYIRYREEVLPYYYPINRYSYENWMNRFFYTIQDISVSYPDYPTTYDIQTMSNFILNLPNIVPCHTSLCKSYITTYIDRERDNLNAITNNKLYLQEFLRTFYYDIKQKFGNELYEDAHYHGI